MPSAYLGLEARAAVWSAPPADTHMGPALMGDRYRRLPRPAVPERSDSECPTCARTLVKRGRLGTMTKLIGLDLHKDYAHGYE